MPETVPIKDLSTKRGIVKKKNYLNWSFDLNGAARRSILYVDQSPIHSIKSNNIKMNTKHQLDAQKSFTVYFVKLLLPIMSKPLGFVGHLFPVYGVFLTIVNGINDLLVIYTRPRQYRWYFTGNVM